MGSQDGLERRTGGQGQVVLTSPFQSLVHQCVRWSEREVRHYKLHLSFHPIPVLPLFGLQTMKIYTSLEEVSSFQFPTFAKSESVSPHFFMTIS